MLKPFGVLVIALSLVTGGPSVAQDAVNPTQVLYALIAQLKAENAELKELLDYQKELRALVDVDPKAALRARRPYSDCEKSVLRHYCQAFAAMYAPAVPDEHQPTVSKGEHK